MAEKNDGATPTHADLSSEKRPIVRRQIYFLRHAQSANNAAQHDDKSADEEQAQSEQQATPSEPSRKKRRLPDPCLTDQGMRQAEQAAYYIENQNNYKIGLVWTSAMRRCVQTAIPFAKKFKVPVKIITDLHEEGGLFEGPRAEEGKNSHPLVHGMTEDEIIGMFPEGIDCKYIPSYQRRSSSLINKTEDGKNETNQSAGWWSQSQGWWRGGFEPAESVKQRCEDITAALFEEIRNPTADPDSSIFIISHGLFIDRLFKHILKIPYDAKTVLMTENSGLSSIQIECDTGTTGWEGVRVALVFHNRSAHIPKEMRTGHSCKGFLIAPADL